MKKYLYLFLFIFILIGCDDNNDNTVVLDEELYEQAIMDAMIADESEISNSLVAITETNTSLQWKEIDDVSYVKVSTFSSYPESFQDSTLTNFWGELWVFVPCQAQQILSDTDNDAKALRLKQLLGLPPDNSNSVIAELWVNPDDLFRPSPDNEITDSVAELHFPEDADADYMIWFNENIYNSYYGEGTKYPWTRLGYTYDWNSSTSEVGISEFCIKANSTVYVEEVYPVESY